MSKRLPYYQSEPAEYLTGDIMFCSFAAQGVFSIISALYWQKDCKLTLGQIKRRVPNSEDFIKELIEEGIIKVKEGFINITFLDEQYNKATNKSKTNSSNGKKGAEARWGKKPTNSESDGESIATPLNNNSESIALREDKIREDKINNKNYLNTVLKDRSYIEITSMQTRSNPDTVIKYLKDFEAHLIRTSEQKQTLKHFKSHFTNWLNKQDIKKIVKIKKIDYGNPNR